MWQLLQIYFSSKKRRAFTIPEFANANKDLLIIICDPETDMMSVHYKNKYVAGRIKSADGKNMHVVKEVLKASRFKDSVDGFIASLAETLNVNVRGITNQFYQFIDGALFNISKSLRNKTTVPAGPMPEGASPLAMGPDGSISKVKDELSIKK